MVFIIQGKIRFKPINPLMVFVVFIIGQFIVDEQDDQDGDCQACSQAKDVYGGVIPVLDKTPQCCLNKITEHGE